MEFNSHGIVKAFRVSVTQIQGKANFKNLEMWITNLLSEMPGSEFSWHKALFFKFC